MKKYFFTFGTAHIHHGLQMQNRWIEIIAESYEIARQLMFARYDDKWAFQYDENNWDPKHFPLGVFEVITQLSPVTK